MGDYLTLNIKSVDLGRTENWLSIDTYAARYDVNRLYHIDFCGTELHHDMPLTDDLREQLMEALVEKFGHAPYDIAEAEAELERSRSVRIWF